MDNDSTPMRTCTQCGEEKPATTEFFRVNNRRPAGLSCACKECLKQLYSGKYLDSDREYMRKRREDPDFRSKENERKREYRDKKRGSPAYTPMTPEQYKENKRRRERINSKTPKYKMKHRIRESRRRARVKQLPVNYSVQDWNNALDYFEGRCAVCGRPQGLWHTIAQDHWIPLNYAGDDNPGTVAWNIVPLCHSLTDGDSGCNNSKVDKHPAEWLIEKFGKREAALILKRIHDYFEQVTPK
jgi:hypothetical protein